MTSVTGEILSCPFRVKLRSLSWEVRFAPLNNGHCEPDLSGPKSANNGLMHCSKTLFFSASL